MIPQQPPMEFNPEKLPQQISILPLFETVLFPKMVLPLQVNTAESIQLVDDAMERDRVIGLVAARNADQEVKNADEDLYRIGTSAMILKMAKTQDNQAQLLVQGISRMQVESYTGESPYLRAQVRHLAESTDSDKEIDALRTNILNHFARIIELTPGLPGEMAQMARSVQQPGTVADLVASIINAKTEEKQKVLEAVAVKPRMQEVTRLVAAQLDILELGNKIHSQVKGDIDKTQREYYLRQQLKAIREELGETDDTNVELEEYRSKVAEKDLPEDALKEAERELKRLERMHPSSAEYTVATTYLDWLTSLPWHESTADSLDIEKARQVLDEDHFGLEKAKKRIIEYLAVRKLKPDSRGPILCFAGPPGTGKTSLGHSIARALGRKFVRISLGGVRDEAEIRGHRRTYVGALPGRIIQGMRRAGVNNPVFMLDEIDKVGSDFRGDPSAALLEVLDPEQNFSFQDHYLDVAFDLSRVMFITTANILDTIPPPLLDRMEVLPLHGYSEEEKIKIAQRYLIPRQREAHGLKANQIKITVGAIKRIISGYTREAGLRNLEREIANVCRGVAARIAGGEVEEVAVKIDDISEFLGPVRMPPEVSMRSGIPGVVMGLAWTPTGGDILFIEAAAMKG